MSKNLEAYEIKVGRVISSIKMDTNEEKSYAIGVARAKLLDINKVLAEYMEDMYIGMVENNPEYLLAAVQKLQVRVKNTFGDDYLETALNQMSKGQYGDLLDHRNTKNDIRIKQALMKKIREVQPELSELVQERQNTQSVDNVESVSSIKSP